MKRLVPVLALVALVGLIAVACGEGTPAASPTATPARSSPSPVVKAPTPTTEPVAKESEQPKETTAEGARVVVELEDPGKSGKYAFDPSKFTFKVGDTVNFKLVAETEFHTFTADDLKIDQSVDAGQTVEFSHTFDKAGTFKLYCIPHETLGMVGEITVQ
jgi:plastocyanin